jgi:WD40 repeat protein
MTTITTSPDETRREPRIALSVTLDRIVPGSPSIVEIVSVIGVLTKIFAVISPPAGALEVPDAHHSGGVYALAVLEREGEPLIISAGADGAVRSWRLDGQPGPLRTEDRGDDLLWSLVVGEHNGEPVIITGSDYGVLQSWRLDSRPASLNVPDAHSREAVTALTVVEHDGAPLITSAGRDGAVRSWRLDGGHGPLYVDRAHRGGFMSLAVLEHHGEPFIISASSTDEAVRSWCLDSRRGPFDVPFAHRGGVSSLAVLEHHGEPLIVSAGVDDTALRSWLPNGRQGPFLVNNPWPLQSLAAIQHHGEPLIVCGGILGGLWSWRLDGNMGPLNVPKPYVGTVLSLAMIEHGNDSVVISGSHDGTIRSWQVANWQEHASATVRGPAWTSFATPVATQLEVRRVSFASPLDLLLQLPQSLLTVPAAFGFVLYAIKRLWGYPLELRVHSAELRLQLEDVEQERERLEASGQLAAIVEALRDTLPDTWELTDGAITDDDN